MRRNLLCLAIATAISVVASAATPVQAADPAAVQRDLNEAAAAYSRLQTQLAQTEARIAKLEADLASADKVIAQKSVIMRERASYLYKSGGLSTYLDGVLSGDLNEVLRRMQLLEMAGSSDERVVESLRVMQSRSDEIRAQLNFQRRHQQNVAEGLRDKHRQLQDKFKGAQGGAKVARYGRFGAFTLPITGPTAFANTWGAPRSGGRRHKGTDVMAPCGAPVVAVTDGVITDMHSGGNGGIMSWVRANNGDVFFYAHLRSYAPGAHVGKRVSVGERIGSNGNTGNARGGPCHVHFEWHPGGGAPRNPYPLLAAAR